jgi:esterase/lipase superfamily enzyme
MAQRTVYFATNRIPITRGSRPAQREDIVDFGDELGPINGIAVRYGSIDIDVDLTKGNADDGAAIVAGSLSVAPERLVGPSSFRAPVLGSHTIFDAVRTTMMTDHKPTLAFIHGFSNEFDAAASRAGWVGELYASRGIDMTMFMFTWPSRQSLSLGPLPYVDYEHDRRTAAASGLAIARTLRTLQSYVDGLAKEQHCEQPIHLLCHSMGNYVLRHSVQALLRSPDPTTNPGTGAELADIGRADPATLRRIFDQIVLAAADEDDDAFDDPQKLKFLPRIGAGVTVYHTGDDWVLSTLSRYTKFNGPRLGNDGPDNMSNISDKVSAIDVSDVLPADRDVQHHQYYRANPLVADDIVAVLRGVRPGEIAGRVPTAEGRWHLDATTPATPIGG